VGVAFLSGTLVLTATVRQAIRQQTGSTARGLAVEVTPAEGFAIRPTMPMSAAATVAAVPGVAATQGEVLGPVVIEGQSKVATDAVAVSVSTSAAFQSLDLRQGRFPSSADEVDVDDATMRAQHWNIGEEVTVGAAAPSTRFTIVGIVAADASQGLSGVPVVALQLESAQRLLGLVGRFSEIEVSAGPGTTPAVLASSIAKVLGSRYEVRTAKSVREGETDADFRAFSLFSTVLVVLGAVVLFVAAFLVVNTFSIVVAQRTRELGLLRCMGASRAQLLASVLAEGLIAGVIAGAVGVVLGIVGAVCLIGVLPSAGPDLPSVSPQIHLVTVLAPIALGTGTTFVASLLPALRATSVPPIAALRDDPVGEAGRAARGRATIGVVTMFAGLGLLMTGLFSSISHEGDVVAPGVVLAFVGLASLSPLAARPLARALGWPLVVWRGLPAGLARQYAMRNPRRTASTAAALLVGVALVSFMAVVTSSARASAIGSISNSLRAGFIVEADLNGDIPLGSGVVDHLRSNKSLRTVVPAAFVLLKIDGAEHSGLAINPSTYSSVVDLGAVQGDIGALGPGTVAVASTEGWKLGERIVAQFSAGTSTELRVAAVFSSGSTFGGLLFSAVHPPPGLTDLATTEVFVSANPDLTPAQAVSAVSSSLAGYPQAQIQDESSLASAAVRQVDRIVNLVTLILILAVIIGLVGIVNTLALSVLERTREVGLLRSLGMSREQIRAMVRHESVIVAVLGAVPGVFIGCLLAWAMQHSLVNQGLNELRVPILTLVVYVVAAGVSGVVAGILPAKRAAELNVLAAISSE
jgi:putative ABC transport system permease protein